MIKRRPLHFRALVTIMIVLALPITLVMGGASLLGHQSVSSFLLKAINRGSPWKIDIAHIDIAPLRGEIILEGVSLRYPVTHRELTMTRVDIGINPLGLLRGTLVISHMIVNGTTISLPASPLPHQPPSHKQLDISRLMFLQNIIVKDARFEDVHLLFGVEKHLNLDTIHCSLDRTLLHTTSIDLRANGLSLTADETSILSAASLTVSATTGLEQWTKAFPHINDVHGKLTVNEAIIEAMHVEELHAELSYRNGTIALKPLHIAISGNAIEGSLAVNTNNASYEAVVDIPQPIVLPHIVKHSNIYDTGGSVSGHVELKGKGFVLREMSGEGSLTLVHRFKAPPDHTNEVGGTFTWKKGRISVDNVNLKSGDALVDISGSVDLAGKRIAVAARGTHFPLEAVFANFRDENINRIFGPTDFEGTFEGWGKKFRAVVHGTTFQGGWQPIAVERIVSDFEATYDRLALKSTLFQGDHETGKADLSIAFGPKSAEGNRSAKIGLAASLNHYDTGPSLFEAYGLQGTGTGTITITGPSTNFNGNVQLSVTGGSWYVIPFDTATTTIDLKRKQLTFREMRITLPGRDEELLSQPLLMDIRPEGFRLHGMPLPGLNIDLKRDARSKKIRIDEIAYTPPQNPRERIAVSGTIADEGLNLRVQGDPNLALFNIVAPLVREASGGTHVDFSITGLAADPRMNGTVEFRGAMFVPRAVRIRLEDMRGIIRFRDRQIEFDRVSANVDDGHLELTGNITHQHRKFLSTDLTLLGTSLTFRSFDGTLRLECDGLVTLKGAFPSPLLAGDLTILDGRYSKDFRLLDALDREKQVRAERAEKEISDFNPRLSLRIRNTGDLFIRNNVGDIGLRMNIEAKGTRNTPKITGAVDATEGKVHYLGLDFDISKGFIEFRGPFATPYLEVTGQKEIGAVNITLLLHGPTDNLALDLQASSPTGPLEKRDIVSLIAFGTTESDRQQTAARQGQLSAQIIASQLTHVVGRPVSRFAHLDTFRLEAADTTSRGISRVYLGKQVSDRFSIDFSSDINTVEALQTVTSEYLITDNLLLKGSSGNNRRFGLRGAIRFRTR